MNHFILLDTETTDLPAEGGAICEIALLEVKDWKIVDKLHFILNPQKSLSSAAAKANRFCDSDFVGKPTFAEIEPEITGWMEQEITIVGYNVEAFDKEMLKREYARICKTMPEVAWVDALKLARKLIPKGEAERVTGLPARSQANVAKYFGIDSSGSHRAMNDVMILLQVYRKLIEKQNTTAVTVSVVAAESVNSAAPPNDKNTAIATISSDEIKNLLKIKPESIITNAISSAKNFAESISARVFASKSLSITNKDQSNSAAAEIAWFTLQKKNAVKERISILAPVKIISSALEEMYRITVTKPLDAAIADLTKLRETYLQKVYELSLEENKKKIADAEATAQMIAGLVFEEAKKTQPLEIAMDVSNKTYDTAISELPKVVTQTTTKTVVDAAKVTDDVYYVAEIVDATVIPAMFLAPDLDLITKFVNKTKGQKKIPGVVITTKVKMKLRKL